MKTPLKGLKATGVLKNWKRVWIDKEEDLSYMTGEVYGDTRGRFCDGQVIHTSLVVRVEDEMVLTLNSVYKLIED